MKVIFLNFLSPSVDVYMCVF